MDEKQFISDFLKEMISLPGISGHESDISKKIGEVWQPLTDQIQLSAIGNLYGIKKASAKNGTEPARRVMMAVHMDGIGMVVERLAGDVLYFAQIGGFDPRILPGQQVLIHTETGEVPGVIAQLAPHLLSKPFDGKPVPLDQLVIDTGMTADELKEAVHPGDIISYANLPFELPGGCIAGHSLDNRASVAAVTQCLAELQRFNHSWDVYAVGTTQEETTFLSGTTVFDVKPDIAIVIDVTFAKGPGVDGYRVKALDSGPSIGFGANIHPALYRQFKALAEQLDMPYTLDPLPSMSGTDAVPIQTAFGGVPTCVLSIPLRYMHTPVEVIALKDVMRVGHLMAEFIARLDDSSLAQLVWED